MRLRRALIIVGFLGLIFLIGANLSGLPKFWAAFRQVQWYVIPLIIITQLAGYYCNARYYQSFFATSRQTIGLRRLFEISLAVNFANSAIPAGGVASATFFAQAVQPEATSGTATLAQLGRYIFTFLSYFPVLIGGFLLLFFSDTSLDHVSVKLILLFMLVILGIGLVLLMIFSERRRMERFLHPFMRLIERVGSKLLRRPVTIIHSRPYQHFLDEFYRGYNEIKTNKRNIWPLLGWSLAGNITEVATVYAVFIGFGQWLNPGIAITAYTLAIIASVLGFLTNGIGVYEVGMIGALVALSVPFALALAIVLVYRVMSMVLFLPPGLHYYQKYLKKDPA